MFLEKAGPLQAEGHLLNERLGKGWQTGLILLSYKLSHREAIQYSRDYVTLWLKRGSGFGSMMHSMK